MGWIHGHFIIFILKMGKTVCPTRPPARIGKTLFIVWFPRFIRQSNRSFPIATAYRSSPVALANRSLPIALANRSSPIATAYRSLPIALAYKPI